MRTLRHDSIRPEEFLDQAPSRGPGRRLLASLPIAIGLILLLPAAGPVPHRASSRVVNVQMADLGPLGAMPATQDTPPAAISAQPGFAPAPIPDPDVDGPAPEAPSKESKLSPSLLSAKAEVQGEGYAYASSEPAAIEKRRPPAAGFSLSVPVE